MALTESRLRQIVREEAVRVMREGPHNRDHGTMWDPEVRRQGHYGVRDTDYPRGGDDEGWDDDEDGDHNVWDDDDDVWDTPRR